MKSLFENWRKYLNEELYHGTSDLYRQDILENGIQAPSYWGTVEIAQYYAEEAVAEKGGNPLIVAWYSIVYLIFPTLPKSGTLMLDV